MRMKKSTSRAQRVPASALAVAVFMVVLLDL
jgi:hypothetical protein